MKDFTAYTNLYGIIISDYKRREGETKFDKICEKINTSQLVIKSMINCKNSLSTIYAKDILLCINSIPYFMFSKNETQCIGALLFQNKWHEEVNKYHSIEDSRDLLYTSSHIFEQSNMVHSEMYLFVTARIKSINLIEYNRNRGF